MQTFHYAKLVYRLPTTECVFASVQKIPYIIDEVRGSRKSKHGVFGRMYTTRRVRACQIRLGGDVCV